MNVYGITECYLVEKKDCMHRVDTMHMNIIRNAHATLKICMWQETCGMDDRSGNISHADEKTKGRTCRTCQFISGLSSWLALCKPLRSVPGQALLWHSSCDGGSLPPPHRRPAQLPQLRRRPIDALRDSPQLHHQQRPKDAVQQFRALQLLLGFLML